MHRRISRFWALCGPAFAVSIGYVDPGNWVTDLMAGRYGCRLLWAVLAASLLALVLQLAAASLALESGEDLCSAVARRWPRHRLAFWLAFEVGAVAADFGEFTGIAVALHLLFGVGGPLSAGLALGLVMSMLRPGVRRFERFMIVTVLALTVLSLLPLFRLHVPWADAATLWLHPSVPDGAAWVILVGVIGATVMPHNLVLHSALVLERCRGLGRRGDLTRFFCVETLVALAVATGVNVAILLLGAALHGASSLGEAYHLLAHVAGPAMATVFAASLLLSGASSSGTATLSGDYVLASLAPFRISPAARRLFTTAPAALALLVGADPTTLLLWSQIALALALPAIMIPMLILLRPLRSRVFAPAVACAACCIAFDVGMLCTLW